MRSTKKFAHKAIILLSLIGMVFLGYSIYSSSVLDKFYVIGQGTSHEVVYELHENIRNVGKEKIIIPLSTETQFTGNSYTIFTTSNKNKAKFKL